MQNKSEKVYLLMDEKLVLSKDLTLNYIQGFNITEKVSAVTIDDVISNIHPSNIIGNEVVMYFNASSGDKWYVSRYFIAESLAKSVSRKPHIRIFYYNSVYIVNTLDDLKTFMPLIAERSSRPSIKVINNYASLGYLSIPDEPIYKCDFYEEDPLSHIKLPIVI